MQKISFMERAYAYEILKCLKCDRKYLINEELIT